MRVCRNCHVSCIGSDRKCPLCGSPLGDPGQSAYAYPAYRIGKHLVKKILATVSLSMVLVMVFINYFTWDGLPYPWSATAAVGILLVWASFRTWISRRMSVGAKMFTSFLIAMVIAVYLDVLTGFDAWSTSYVIPAASAASTMALTVLTMTGRKRYPNFFSYMMIFMFISLASPVLYLLSLAKVKWIAMLPLLCGAICFISLAIIRKRDITVELKKRFRL